MTAVQGNGLFYQAHSGGLPGAVMQPLRVTIPAGRTGDELYRHEGEEWLYVLSGELCVTLGKEVHDLGAGDSIHFPPLPVTGWPPRGCGTSKRF